MNKSKQWTFWTTGTVLIVAIGIYFTWVNQAPSNAPALKIETTSVDTRDIQDSVREMGTVDIGKMVIASTPVATKLLKIYVKQGDFVKKGQLLFQLDKSDVLTAEKDAKATLDHAKEILNKLKKQPEPELVAQAETVYIQSSTAFLNAERMLDTNQDLLKEGFISKVAFQQSKDEFDIAKRKLNLAKQAYDKATTLPAPDDLAKADADIDKSKQELNKIHEQLDQCDYKAQFNGKVLDCFIKPTDWEIHPQGVPLAQNNAVLRLGDPYQIFVKTEVFESEIKKISVGQKAVISSETLGDKQLTGTVQEIGSFAIPVGNLHKFPITLKINSDSAELKPGTSVEAKIIVSERKNVSAIPLKYLRDINGHTVVTRLVENKRETVDVKTGLDDGKFIEIQQGLAVGDRILAEQAK